MYKYIFKHKGFAFAK